MLHNCDDRIIVHHLPHLFQGINSAVQQVNAYRVGKAGELGVLNHGGVNRYV